MKYPHIIIVALVAAMGFGWVSAEKRTNTSLRKQLAQLNADRESQANKDRIEIARLQELRDALEIEARSLRERLAGDPGETDARPGNPARAGSDGTSDKAAAGEKKPTAGAGWAKTMEKMFTDPEMKKAMRAQQAMGIRMLYGELATELGLTPEEANQVMELLADRQMEMTGQGMKMMNEGGSESKQAEESAKQMQASREKFDQQLQSTLGGRYQQFQEYEKTIGDRAMLQQYQQAFSSTGMPLEESQRAGLLQIMTEERAKLGEDGFNTPNVAAQMKAFRSEEAVDQFSARQQQFNQRVLNRSREILSADQILQFEGFQKQQFEAQQMGIKMSREMMNVKSYGAGDNGK